jgi:hypothetical protein
MPLRSVKLTAAEAAALRELTRRFAGSELAAKAARHAVESRCARLARASKQEFPVLCKGANRIDVLSREEYLATSGHRWWE